MSDVLLVDDVRGFRDGRDCHLARTAEEAIAVVRAHEALDEIWLDHDLGPADVWPLVEELLRTRFPVRQVLVHSANPAGALRVRQALTAAGYDVVRHHDRRIWRHAW